MKSNFILALFMATATLSFGQWTTDLNENTLVSTETALDMLPIVNSEGETFVFFWKNVGAPVNIELRLQILNADGETQLGDAGALVSDQIAMGTFTMQSSVTIDEDDNIYVGVTGSNGYTGHILKIDSDGNNLWTDTGVSFPTGYLPSALPLGNGDVLVSWFAGADTKIQKYNSNGDAQWAEPKSVAIAGSNAAPEGMFLLSNGDVMFILHKFSFGVSSTLHAHRIDTNGDAVWTAPVQISDVTTAYNKQYSMVQDGDNVYVGYSAAIGSRFDAFLQFVQADGSIPWGMNGADFDISQGFNEMQVKIAMAEGSDDIFAIASYTNSAQGDFGEYVQKFNKTGGDRGFTDSAKEIFAVAGNNMQHAGALRMNNGLPYFLIADGMQTGVNPVTLKAVELNLDGDFNWDEETKSVATYPESKGRVFLSHKVNNQYVVVFTENRDDGSHVYAQNIVDSNVSAPTLERADLNLQFANPIKENLNVLSEKELKTILILDIQGRKVYEANLNNASVVDVNTSTWAQGVYLMTVSTKDGVSQGYKLIKN